MNIYFAEVDDFYSLRPDGEGEPAQRRRHLLVEAPDIHAAWKEAEKVAAANAGFGPRLIKVDVRMVHRVALPAEVQLKTTSSEDSSR